MSRIIHYGLMLFPVMIFMPALLHSQAAGEQTIVSRFTGDKYIITIKNHQPALKQHVVYVADGSLKLGQYILGTDNDWKAAVPANCVIVAIAHVGDWHEKRRRDFIPSDAGGYQDKEFGKSVNFYQINK